MSKSNQQPADVLAWTTKDGLTPPPRGVRPKLLGGSALGMAGIWVGLLSVDTLCPEHRMWVEALAVGALFASILAIAGLVKHRSWAAPFALLSATLGISIGVIDAVHDSTRGVLVALAFTALAAVLALTVARQYQSTRWARTATAELRAVDQFDDTNPTVSDERQTSSTETASAEEPTLA